MFAQAWAALQPQVAPGGHVARGGQPELQWHQSSHSTSDRSHAIHSGCKTALGLALPSNAITRPPTSRLQQTQGSAQPSGAPVLSLKPSGCWPSTRPAQSCPNHPCSHKQEPPSHLPCPLQLLGHTCSVSDSHHLPARPSMVQPQLHITATERQHTAQDVHKAGGSAPGVILAAVEECSTGVLLEEHSRSICAEQQPRGSFDLPGSLPHSRLHPHCCGAPPVQGAIDVFVLHPAPGRLAVGRLQATQVEPHTTTQDTFLCGYLDCAPCPISR